MTEHNWFYEYCEKTTTYGMRYLVMKNRSHVEKAFWILVFICMISGTVSALVFLTNIWIKNPTVMLIENTETDIYEIPFPSIKICPVNQLRKRQPGNETNRPNWDSLHNYLNLLCYSNYNQPVDIMGQTSLNYIDYDIYKKWVNDYSVTCSEMFQSHVKWQNFTIKNICEFVQPSLFMFGTCFTLNLIPMFQMVRGQYYQRYLDFFSNQSSFKDNIISKWNLDDGYSAYFNKDKKVLSNDLPVRPENTRGVGYYHRFRVVLYSLKTDEILSCPNIDLADGSFLIMLANPIEIFSIDPSSFVVPDSYTRIQITPFVKKINRHLKWRSLEVRKCYLHNERNLSIFLQYSESNCNYECKINETITMCGCIFFEAAYLTKGMKICGPGKKECIQRAIQASSLSEMQKLCNCLPTCTVIEYEITNTAHYDNWTYMKETNLVKNNSRGATIEFLFKNPYFTAYKTESILSLDLLISNIGGILSLFLGLNLLNFFEIFYVLIQMVISFILRIE